MNSGYIYQLNTS